MYQFSIAALCQFISAADNQLNPLGQVIQQTSPAQRKKDAAQPSIAHSTTMVYDDLGRMTERNEYDLTARWVYDGANCRADKSCGKLKESYTLLGGTSSNTKDNQQSHTYDNLGRPSTTVLQRDVNYTQRLDYDDWGRPLKESWQRGTATAKVYERRYNAWGYQHQLLKATGANSYLVLWQADEQDASQRLSKATLGNGRLIQRDYYANSGRLYANALKIDKDHDLLTETISYDVLGNIDQRNQQWAAIDQARPADGFTEIFSYDGLNRLKSASVTGYPTQVFNYDAIGNIKNKTGTGTGDYVYPSSGISGFDNDGTSTNRPHAVKEIPGIGSFNYDANGNLENGNGRTITWTSFDMPADGCRFSSAGVDKETIEAIKH